MSGNSMLIIYQLRPYQEYLSKPLEKFEEIEFTHLLRERNQFVDVLAILVVMARIDFGYKVQLVHIDMRNFSAHCCSVEEEIDRNP
jgi:hypothetical protein